MSLSRREALKIIGLIPTSVALAACGGSEYAEGPILRGIAPNVPSEAINAVYAAEQQGKAVAYHGTSAWSLLAGPMLQEMGYSSECTDGLYAFGGLVKKGVPWIQSTRHHLRPPTSAGFDQLWVASSNPRVDVGTEYLKAQMYAEKLGTGVRVYDPSIAQNVISGLDKQLAELRQAQTQGIIVDQVLIEQMQAELDFNRNRLNLYNNLNALGGRGQTALESWKVPVLLSWEPEEGIIARKGSSSVNAVVKTNSLPYQNLKTIYINRSQTAVIQELQSRLPQIAPNAQIIAIDGLEIMKEAPPVPWWYASAWKAAQVTEASIQALPYVGTALLVGGPEVIWVADFSNTMGEYHEALAQGRTNLAPDEWYETFNQFLNTLDETDLYDIFLPEKPNKFWYGASLPFQIPVTVPLMVPNNLPIYERVGEGDLWGFKQQYFRIHEAEGEQIMGDMEVTYIGIGPNNRPMLRMQIVGYPDSLTEFEFKPVAINGRDSDYNGARYSADGKNIDIFWRLRYSGFDSRNPTESIHLKIGPLGFVEK